MNQKNEATADCRLRREELENLLKTRLNQFEMLTRTIAECVERGGADMTITTLEGEISDLLDEIKEIRRDLFCTNDELAKSVSGSGDESDHVVSYADTGGCVPTYADAVKPYMEDGEAVGETEVYNNKFVVEFNSSVYKSLGKYIVKCLVDSRERELVVTFRNSTVEYDGPRPFGMEKVPLTYVLSEETTIDNGIDILYFKPDGTLAYREAYHDVYVKSVWQDELNYGDFSVNNVVVAFGYRSRTF